MIQVTFALSFIVSAGSSKASSLPGSLQRSRSDIDVNAAAGAKAHHAAGQSVRNGRLGAGALNPGSYASLGKTTDYGKLYHVLSLISVKTSSYTLIISIHSYYLRIVHMFKYNSVLGTCF